MKKLSIVVVGGAPLLIRLILLPVMPIPAPRIHDEFSHLLLADTFAHGRLVNPVHRLWVHFDSMHILTRPVYGSVYPVAQGAIMAAAQVVTGTPWIGVWLSMGLMCGALCWMLQGWVSPGWALLGSALYAARFGVSSYWMNSYYGGALAAFGGALVLGAAPRLLKRRHWRDSAVLGTGLVVLANSRPYEGLIFSLPILAFLMQRLGVKMFAAPLAVTLGIGAAAMGYYFARFTGNPAVMPYQFFCAHFKQAPHFIFQSPRPRPVYYHRATEDYYSKWEMASYYAARANRSPNGVLDKAKSYSRFFIGPALAIPLIFSVWRWNRLRIRVLVVVAIMSFASLVVEVWHAPHYAAPVMGVILLLMVEGLRYLRQTSGGRWSVGLVCVASFLVPVLHGGFRVGDGRPRADIQKHLQQTGERHLVLVRYTTTHDPGNEWVYNGADIDSQQVVWAREMDASRNHRLREYFAGRHVWLAEPDTNPVRLSPYDFDSPPTVPSDQRPAY